ncbi:hypothetical protein L7F22_054067 [Adiantum nelumboides]|nr:hypothetical protein [Adiantum nelumboides]
METLMNSSCTMPRVENRGFLMESCRESLWLCRDRFSAGSQVCKQVLRKAKQLRIQAIDAAQPFDFESKKLQEMQNQKKLKIGLVGFGNYGQFLSQTMVKQGHTVLAHSRSDYSEIGRKMRVQFFRDADDFCEEHPEVIVLCTSILSTEGVLQALPMQRLRRNTLFVDVLSVKEFPRNLFLQA